MCGNIISACGNVISVDIESGRNVTAMVRNIISAHHRHCLFRSDRTLVEMMTPHVSRQQQQSGSTVMV